MTKKLTDIAEKIYFKHPRLNSKSALRDICDLESGGELDCTQIDILLDMVIKRVNNPQPGEFFDVEHQRKGKFTIQLKAIDDEWMTGIIVEGKAGAALFCNERYEGEEITMRRNLCFFYPRRASLQKVTA